MKKTILFLALIQFIFTYSLYSQKGKEQTIFVSVEYGEVGGATLSWPDDPNFTGTYNIFENKSEYTQDFEYVDFVTGNSWTDNSYEIGTTKEILVTKKEGNRVTAFNVISIGKEVEVPFFKGGIILLVDETHSISLENEIFQVQNELLQEGWEVIKLDVPRTNTPEEIKQLILQVKDGMLQELKAIYIIGHVPVPYSGHFSLTGTALPPDGHIEGSGNHTGAWPADMFYGDLDGNWTDQSVNYTDSKSERNKNIPGDGKFDQSAPPSDIDVIVSRVDFYDMAAFLEEEVELLRNYLQRTSSWRQGRARYIYRGLIDDNFKSLNISASAYRAISNLIGTDSLFDDRDYLTEIKYSETEFTNYYFSFGMGAGSYTSCNGIGKTNDFVENKIKTIFTGLSGSYFGDWDSKNNILRATLASGALGSFWSGIPHWYLNKLGVGGTIGDCLLYTQNADYVGSNITVSLNGSQRKVHTTLMGDPTLTFNPVHQPAEINVTKEAGAIRISWEEDTPYSDGHFLYRMNNDNGEIVKVNDEIITGKEYIDVTAPTGSFTYILRATNLVELPNSSYYSVGMGSFSEPISYVTSVNYVKDNDFVVAPNPSSGSFRIDLPANVNNIETLEIRDMTGNIVYKHTGNLLAEQVISTNLATGSYVLIANTKTRTLIKKLQIVR
ncbi:MAG: T9SS type A sorting domain-containing protein [Chlorobiota bacterium]